MSDEPSPRRLDADGGVRFRLPIYEGPLDLLLHLLKRAELDPHEVTASVITEQYLAWLELLDQLNLDVAGEYLVMAATLLLIKSFAMLPHPELADTEEAEELKRDLVERLLEYQRYREAAEKLSERAILGRDVFTTPGESAPEDANAKQYTVSIFDLVEAIGAVLKRVADKTPRAIELRDIPVGGMYPANIARAGRRGANPLHGAVRGRQRSLAGDCDLHGAARIDPPARRSRVPGSALRRDFARARRRADAVIYCFRKMPRAAIP